MFRKCLRLITAAAVLAPVALAAAAQTVTFGGEGIKYEIDLPTARWRAAPRLDVHDHFDFVRGVSRADGYLRVREYLAGAGTTPEELFRREQSRTLKSLPGYVECTPCSGENFAGRLSGSVFAYEYTEGGVQMAGRVYYLRASARSFYGLHFTGERRKMQALRGELDAVARSFRLK